MTCHYCGCVAKDADDLRPYGPNDAMICHPCGSSPEHYAETARAIETHMRAVLDAALTSGAVTLLGDGPPRVSQTPPRSMQ